MIEQMQLSDDFLTLRRRFYKYDRDSLDRFVDFNLESLIKSIKAQYEEFTEARDKKRQEEWRLRELALAPYAEAIKLLTKDLQDARYVGGPKVWVRCFLEEYVLSHHKLPEGVHPVSGQWREGRLDVDFSALRQKYGL